VYRRYTLDEVRRKIIDVLQSYSTGLSGIELADKTGMNRMTITKYLDILYTMGLVKKKKVGSVNIWFLETGVADIEFPVNYLQIQQKLVSAVLSGEEDQARRIVISAINSTDFPVRVLTDVIMPAVNTIAQLYARGKLDKTERIFLLNIISEIIDLVKFNVRPKEVKAGAHLVSVAGSEDMVHIAKSAAVAFQMLGWNSAYIGNVEDHIDPFFDIDFQRFIAKLWGDKRGLMVICIFSSGEGSLQFLSSTAKAIKPRLKGELVLVAHATPEVQAVTEEIQPDFLAKDLQSLIDRIEQFYSKKTEQ